MTDIKQKIDDALSKAVGQPVNFELSQDFSKGDFASPIALKLAKEIQKNPFELAQELVAKISQDADLSEAVRFEAIAPGFINVWLKDKYLFAEVTRLAQTTPGEKISDAWQNQTVLIDYSSPNIAKPMHIGHLRSTIIGESLKRLVLALGGNAIGINHLGDWGSQFGKLLAAYKRWGSPEELEKGSIQELFRLYVKFHEELEKDPSLAAEGAAEFAKLEAGDQENRQIWEHLRRTSLDDFEAMYRRLDITIDEPEMGESFYEEMLRPLIDEAVKKGAAEESDGALVIRVGEEIPPAIIQKSDGTTIYATRDLAALKYRIERWHPTKVWYVVANEQDLHFRQVFGAAEKLGLGSDVDLKHVPFGLIRLTEGKLSTRGGRVIFLEDVLNEAVVRARALVDATSQQLSDAEKDVVSEAIGIGAVKYQDLKQFRQTAITFDWEKMLTLQGNTGPYLQYAVARANSILRKAQNEFLREYDGIDDIERQIIRWVVRLPQVVERAANEMAPNYLAEWLYQLAGLFNNFYETHPVLSSEGSERERRLAIADLVAKSLTYGLNLLGISAPERL